MASVRVPALNTISDSCASAPGADQRAELLKVDDERRREHGEDGFFVSQADHGFHPHSARDMRHSRLLQRGEGSLMRERGVGNVNLLEQVAYGWPHRHGSFSLSTRLLLQRQHGTQCTPDDLIRG
jgi:hypothetical protein